MKRILLVDDSPISRNLLATVLESAGYGIVQATSGEEALALAAAELPDLVITDIVMPSMDGFEFVTRLRQDRRQATLPVVFYTGVKHEQEARALASSCGASNLIAKPSDPETILSVVASALSLPSAAPSPTPFMSSSPDRDVVRLLGDELSEAMAERESTYLRMAGLIEIGRVLSSHRDPRQLLQRFCEMARDILGASVAAVGARTDDGSEALLYTAGMALDAPHETLVDPKAGVLRHLLDDEGAVVASGPDADPARLGLPAGHPPLTAFLGVPIATRGAIHGWFYVGQTQGQTAFTDDDERLSTTLARQLAVAYENARLYDQLKQEYERAQIEVEERRRAERELKLRLRQLATLEQLSAGTLAGVTWAALLQETTDHMLETLDADYCYVIESPSDAAEMDARSDATARSVLSRSVPRAVPSAAREGDPLTPPRALVLDDTAGRAYGGDAFRQDTVNGDTAGQHPLLQERGVRASIATVIQGRPRPYGVIEVHRLTPYPFTERDGHFMQSVANLLASAVERMHAQEQLLTSHQQLRELASRLQTIREDERTHVAREIHDELGQSLTAIKIELSFLGKSLTREDMDHLMPRVNTMGELIDQTIHQVRRLSTELRPGVLDHLGLVAAVEWQVDEFRSRTDIDCQLTTALNDQGLSDERCTALFRILQETLTNVARHANASEVSVSLRQEHGNLVLEVSDNGKGFDKEGARFTSLGLLGMRERALLLGGELFVGSVPGKGSKIAVKIPFSDVPHEATRP